MVTTLLDLSVLNCELLTACLTRRGGTNHCQRQDSTLMDQLLDPLRQTQDSVTFKKETRILGTSKSPDSNLGTTKGLCYIGNRQNGQVGFTTLAPD